MPIISTFPTALKNHTTHICNPNLLDNWYFVDPVDQRGGYVVPPGTNYFTDSVLQGITTGYVRVVGYDTTGVYPQIIIDGVQYACPAGSDIRGYTGTGHTIDRWRVDLRATSLTIGDDGTYLNKTDGGANQSWLGQALETNIIDKDTQYTLSILVNDGELYTGTGVFPAEGAANNDWAQISNVCNLYAQHRANNWPSIGVYIPASTTITKIIAIKLELGDTQTLARLEGDKWVLTEIPNKNIELLKCCMNTSDSSDTYANNMLTAEAIDAISSNIKVTTDCNIDLQSGGNQFLVSRYNQDTLNSPLSEGLVTDGVGMVLTYAYTANYGRQICLTGSGGGVCQRHISNGTISKWDMLATETNAWMESAPTSTDCNADIQARNAKVFIRKYNANTLNSPYKEGKTTFTQGVVITYAYSSTYGTQIAFAGGSAWVRVHGGTGTTEWSKLATTDYAVNKAGDTMTGSTFYLNSGYGQMLSNANQFRLGAQNGAEAQLQDNARFLQLCSRAYQSDVVNALRLIDRIGGADNYYPILHTGNSNMTRLVSTETNPSNDNEINWTFA